MWVNNLICCTFECSPASQKFREFSKIKDDVELVLDPELDPSIQHKLVFSRPNLTASTGSIEVVSHNLQESRQGVFLESWRFEVGVEDTLHLSRLEDWSLPEGCLHSWSLPEGCLHSWRLEAALEGTLLEEECTLGCLHSWRLVALEDNLQFTRSEEDWIFEEVLEDCLHSCRLVAVLTQVWVLANHASFSDLIKDAEDGEDEDEEDEEEEKQEDFAEAVSDPGLLNQRSSFFLCLKKFNL